MSRLAGIPVPVLAGGRPSYRATRGGTTKREPTIALGISRGSSSLDLVFSSPDSSSGLSSRGFGSVKDPTLSGRGALGRLRTAVMPWSGGDAMGVPRLGASGVRRKGATATDTRGVPVEEEVFRAWTLGRRLLVVARLQGLREHHHIVEMVDLATIATPRSGVRLDGREVRYFCACASRLTDGARDRGGHREAARDVPAARVHARVWSRLPEAARHARPLGRLAVE
jgi:hypothetical protein